MKREWTSDEEGRFINIYTSHKNEMYQCAYRILRNDADAQDAVQNALICILEKIKAVPWEAGKERAYVLTAAKYAAINIYRGNKKRVKLYGNMTSEIALAGQKCGADPFRRILAKEESDVLRRLLEVLNEEQCEIIKLRYLDEFSVREIAALLNLREGTVNTRLCRARKILEKELKRQKEWDDQKMGRGIVSMFMQLFRR